MWFEDQRNIFTMVAKEMKRRYSGLWRFPVDKDTEISTGAFNPTCFVGVPGLKNIESGRSSLDTPGFHQI